MYPVHFPESNIAVQFHFLNYVLNVNDFKQFFMPSGEGHFHPFLPFVQQLEKTTLIPSPEMLPVSSHYLHEKKKKKHSIDRHSYKPSNFHRKPVNFLHFIYLI